MTNNQVLERVLEDIKLRGLSPHTRDEYMDKIKVFMRYFDKSVTELDEQDIRQFLKFLIEERKCAVGTVNCYNSALRFLYGATLNRTLNYRQIPRLRQVRRLPEILTREEICKMFEVCDNLKYRTILMTIYGAGLRLSEVMGLRIRDIDSKSMRIFVNQGKGGKDRYTLLSAANLEILREYWKTYKPSHTDGYLFLNNDGTTHISYRAIQDAFHKYKSRAGVLKNVTVHTLRHCFATHLLEADTDVCRIKQLLGHTHIQSTTFYLHLLNFDSSLKSPLDTLNEQPKKKRGRKPKKTEVHANG